MTFEHGSHGSLDPDPIFGSHVNSAIEPGAQLIYILGVMKTGEPHPRAVIVFLISLAVVPLTASSAPQVEEQLARAQELLDGGDAQAALNLLDPLTKKKPPNAQVFLLRSTALFMLGALDHGKRDLEHSLKLDPSLRQAWLNMAALDLSEERYAEALRALEKAKELDPTAPENELNIGAVLLMQGQLQGASNSFKSYLERNPTSAEAFYLVASNYAMAGFAGPAIENLRQAIELDEKTRLRARTDPNFRDLETNSRFQMLLITDSFEPAPGSYQRILEVEVPYAGSDGHLLRAVLDALQFSGQPFDRRVEATADWALIWGELRIKVTNSAEGKGRIELSAPADQFTPNQWQQATDAFIREITIRLHTRGR